MSVIKQHGTRPFVITVVNDDHLEMTTQTDNDTLSCFKTLLSHGWTKSYYLMNAVSINDPLVALGYLFITEQKR